MNFRTKQDQVAEILRERIIAGDYQRGEKLKQVDLAAQLGVSVTPVREALRILEAEGFVVSLSHRGVLVPPFVLEQAQEIYELRMLLEPELTRLAVGALTADKLAELHALHRSYVEASESGERLPLRTANYRFHFRLYELANRPQTLQFVRVLWAKYPFHYLDAIPERTRSVGDEHDAFLAKLDAGDLDGAVDAMIEHIRAGWTAFTGNQLRETPPPEPAVAAQ